MEQASVQAALHELRQKYLEGLPGKLEIVNSLFEEYQSTGNPDSRQSILAKVHQLAGSGATFGCKEVSDISREMVDLCRSERDKQEFIYYFFPLLERLSSVSIAYRQQAARLANHHVIATESDDRESDKGKPLVYILDDDEMYAELLHASLTSRGYAASIFTNPHYFLDALKIRRPNMAIIDLVLSGNGPSGEDVAQVCHLTYGIPFVIISENSDFDSRLTSVKTGAYSFLSKPVDFSRLVNFVDQCTHINPDDAYRVLIVDDDSELTHLYKSELSSTGMVVEVMNHPEDVLGGLSDFNPDVIVLDIEMPGISGIELGSIIRQFEQYNHIPLLFLTGDSSLQTRITTSLLGGDDFFLKPMPPEVLNRIIRGRAVRARNMRQGSQKIKKLRERLELLNKAADQHSIISITDIRGEIQYVNQQFIETYGYDESEILGCTHQIISAGLQDKSFYHELWETVTSGKVWQGEIINKTKHGQYVYLHTTIMPEKTDSGLHSGYIAISTDITPVKRLEQHLTKEADRLNLALESTHSGMWEIDITNGKTYYSLSWRHFFGPDVPQEGRHDFWQSLVHPEDLESIVEAMLEVMSIGEGVVRSEHRLINLKGEYDWVIDSFSAVEFDNDGWPTRIVGITQLINERKQLEENQLKMQKQLIQSQKLEAVGHLTAGVAHDFNNMLGAMLGYTELLKELGPAATESPDKYAKYLGEIFAAGKRAKELITQMLTFARLSPDLNDDEIPNTLVQPVVKEVVYMLGSSIPSTISINYSLSSDNIRARIQPVQLHQIFLNLVVNARDAMEEHGQIDIVISQTSPGGCCASCFQEIQGNYIEICVADTGCGIDSNTLKSMFDPFFTTKDVDKGSGMGLSVVHGVVHGLGGHIKVESDSGIGTKLYIYLPDVASDELPAAEDDTDIALRLDEELLAGKSILVVDDELGICAMLTDLLTMYGANVTSFSCSLEAMETFENNPFDFDIVITDETMPNLTGFEMAKQMMALRHGLPVILCSGFNNRVDEQLCREHGIRAYMRKPIELDALIKNIDEFVKV